MAWATCLPHTFSYCDILRHSLAESHNSGVRPVNIGSHYWKSVRKFNIIYVQVRVPKRCTPMTAVTTEAAHSGLSERSGSLSSQKDSHLEASLPIARRQQSPRAAKSPTKPCAIIRRRHVLAGRSPRPACTPAPLANGAAGGGIHKVRRVRAREYATMLSSPKLRNDSLTRRHPP